MTWGSVASLLAHRRGRPFAVWTDRVESAVLRAEQRAPNRRVALRARLYAGPTALLERMAIRRATLGLFHGQETYETYAPQARRAEMVHDISLTRADHITPEALAAKIARAGEGPLQILYVGRLAPMKGPMDWLATLAALRDAGIAFEARWIGEGPSRAEVEAECARLGLEDHVRFPGFLGDRAAVLEACRAAHVLLFCHLTPESPRNLIEALVSGTPILGYADAYARDLIRPAGGGRLVARGAVRELAGELARLARDRVALADLITRAARDGTPFDADRVFAHRSALIRRYLGAG
ncbi:glycosyltransferase [Roseivivax sp. GX 12232]|uniref:glycosyltransferase n=1 Tax=Roseivivax sp. GX 12232 TaxID=2900547 RepID=UPI001E2A5EFF|nr:glycosyltransferase [Roseivivax sp. GX 12232]